MGNQRVVIVDLNHIAHTYYHSQHRLSITVVDRGARIPKDTTIQNGILKNLYKWSNGGSNPTAVCMDRPVPARKAFFQKAFSDMKVGTSNEYKGDRVRMAPEMFEALSDIERILNLSGVTVYAQEGYEADDLVYASIKYAKQKYEGMPVDVITNDADLLPLVDDTVSVFLRSRKGTYAESEDIKKLHYVQVTPRNYEEVLKSLSAYKGFYIPYNCILLHKLLRGDLSDKFGRKDISREFSPKKWNAMIEKMEADGVPIESIFRYGEPQSKIMYRDSGLEFEGTMEDAVKSPNRSNLYQKIQNTKELDAILDVLKGYTNLSEVQLHDVEQMYWGMNLNQVYPNADPMYSRRAFVCGTNDIPGIDTFSEVELQKVASSLQINLIRY